MSPSVLLPPPPEPAAAPPRHACILDGVAWHRCFTDPELIFTSKDARGTLSTREGARLAADGDPFRITARLLRDRPNLIAAGYWSYDLRHHLERLPRLIHDDLHLPDCWLAFYPQDPETPHPPPNPPPTTDSPSPLGEGRGGGPAGHPFSTPDSPSPLGEGWGGGSPHWRTPRPQYLDSVRRVLDYIAAGDCYQVNLSHRASVPYPGEPWALYERLCRESPAPYSAYLDCGDHHVLSASPELFLRVRGRDVETRPIKGTRPRGRTPAEDAALAAELLASAKDRAELLMIVDLERNDLGRVCEYGSVHVPELYALESFASVHHLVATVRGRLRREVGPLECLRAAFPGGSITGAPKIRAMEIIEELEPVRRGVYTGAIGWADGRGNGEWSIAIRTMVLKNGVAHLHAGGGIVADSDPDAEYEETLAKAHGMLRALGVG